MVVMRRLDVPRTLAAKQDDACPAASFTAQSLVAAHPCKRAVRRMSGVLGRAPSDLATLV